MGRFDEQKLQEAVARFLDHYPGVLWFHPANERKTPPHRGKRLQRQGVKRGVPDIWIMEPRGQWNGLVIELKTKTGSLTPDQRQWICRLNNRGYAARVCKGLDQTLEVIHQYFATGDIII